jgi:V/A-type H+-transporting ATPase subunit I
MIVKMKKLTLLCTRSSQAKTLAALRDLGAVHLQHIQPPEGADLDEARNLFDHLRRALEVLPKHPHIKPSGKRPYDTVKAVWDLIHRKQALTEQIEALELEIRHYEPFGSFSPETVRDLNAKGVTVKLYKTVIKEMPSVPEGAQFIELSRDRTTVYFALIGRAGMSVEAEEIALPAMSLSDMREKIAGLQAELVKTESEFHGYAGDRAAVATLTDEAEDRVHYLEARTGMGGTEEVWYLRGFFPAEQEKALRAEAAKNGWAVLVEEPSAADPVPTLLRNPKWVKPIQAVLDVIGVTPGYHELDISALFLIFLSIFFAFLVGDAGYGLLFIGLTLFGKFKLRGNEKAAPGLNLLMIMSVCTIIWGALTGTWFGITPDAMPAPFQHLRWNYLTGSDDLVAQHIMFICFVLGTVHLAIAHFWNLFRKINTWGALSDVGWLCSTATMFFAVCNMVLGYAFPPVMLYVLIAGIVLIILSLILEKSYFGLVTLVLDVISNFVDIISYVRLYAVGAASYAIANSFNKMAVEALGSRGMIVGGLIAALCIFGGHILNIVLGAMAILVHGIRLNTLEFSGHAGVRWAGVPFKPFAKRAEDIRPEEITG